MKTKLLLSAFLLFTALISQCQWTRTYLTEGTILMAGATLGTEAFFAGGYIVIGSDWIETDNLQIYNLATDTWRLDYLSQARQMATGVTCGDWIFVAGGVNNFPFPSSRVDIISSLGVWDYTELSVPRFALSAVSNDSLVLFAGGGNIATNESYDVVDIYNIYTLDWDTAYLSEPRAGMGCAVTGDLAFFAGGDIGGGTMSDRVDIYHFSTGEWDTSALSQARTWIGATAAQNKVIFAGGILLGGELSNVVDIYDTGNGTWSTATLSMARGFFGQQSVTVGGKAYFVGGTSFETDYDTIDVYDPVADTWEVITMPNRLTDHTVVAVDTSLLIGGGFTYTSYPYGIVQPNVEIYTDPMVGGLSRYIGGKHSNIFPNPSTGTFHIGLPGQNDQDRLTATILNMQGQVVYNQTLDKGNPEVHVDLPDGVYLLQVISDKDSKTVLITIQK